MGPTYFISGGVLLFFTFNYIITAIIATPAQFVFASGKNPFALTTILYSIISNLGIVILCPKIGLIGYPISLLFSLIFTNGWKNLIEYYKLSKMISAMENNKYSL
jgi:hypothetical protein